MEVVGVVEYQPLSQESGEEPEQYVSRNLDEYARICRVASKRVMNDAHARRKCSAGDLKPSHRDWTSWSFRSTALREGK